MIASGVRFDLALGLIVAVLAVATVSDAARAQEGWPYSAWEDNKREKKPAPTANEAMPPMEQAPRFRDPRTGGAYGGAPAYGGQPAGQGSSPAFATPPSVDRVDLSPLEPVAPTPGGDGAYGADERTSPSSRRNSDDYGGRPREDVRAFDPTQRRGPSGGSADVYSKPAAETSSSWSASTTPGADQLAPEDAERLFKALSGSPKSRTLRELLRPVVAGNGSAGGRAGQAAAAARLDAQLRLGFVEEAAAFQIPSGLDTGSADWAGFALRRSVAMAAIGREEEACRDARDIIAVAEGLPAKDKDLGILLSGYCGALAKTSAAVSLAADVARDRSGFDPAALAGLEAMARGSRPRIPATLQLSPLAYRALQMAGASPEDLVAAKADAALLAAMPSDQKLPAESRIVAAEKAAEAFILAPERLADAYASAPRGADIESMTSGSGAHSSNPSQHRAGLFVSATRQPTPLRKVRLVRAFLDSSAKAGIAMAAFEIMGETVARIRPVQEIGWFAETAVEVLLIGGRIDEARQWLQLAAISDPRGPRALSHWAALVDIADASRTARRGDSLASLESMALRGDFRPAELHRLATVLDALDYQVPIPLWEAASRTPQPTDGHLPPTGVLSELQQAAKSGEHAKTVLLVANAIGPDGPAGAHMIALGDTIRALKRAGMEREARRLGLEALFLAWPRSAQG